MLDTDQPLLSSIDDIFALGDPQWLIRDLLPLPGLVLLYGKSGFGKSFCAIDFALSVASGTPWLGKYPVMSGAVVYVACEGATGLKRRIAAWLHHHPDVAKPDRLSFCLQALDIYDGEERERFLSALETRYRLDHFDHVDPDGNLGEPLEPLRRIVLDTLARVYQGEDENSVVEMSEFIQHIESFARDIAPSALLDRCVEILPS